MKNAIKFFALLGLCVAPLSQAATLSFDPPQVAVSPGQHFDLTLMIDGVSDLTGLSVVFTYTSAIIMPIGADPGQIFQTTPCESWLFVYPANGDSIQVDEVLLGGCGSSGSGSVARLHFVARASGVTTFAWRSGILRDTKNQDILATWEYARVMVAGPVPVRSTTWGRLKSLYR